ncbi:MAG: hypothetical protein D6731_03300 [Planctomycetota bacterium]|nr:MAG: hypothetical protein D6731_03300 [Planctomycetota bacterium]
MPSLSWQERWNLLFRRLNELESRSDGPHHRVLARALAARLASTVPERLLLRPAAGEGELGPPCRRCAARLSTAQLLVACTACLEAAHYECWRREGGCPHPVCRAERGANAAQAARGA